MRVLAIDPGTTESARRKAARARAWRKSHPGYDKRPYRNTASQKKAESRYRRSAKGRKRNVLRLRVLRREEPAKPRARDAVKYAVRTGFLVRPKRCQECKAKSSKLHAHHPDYSKRLLVEWLCPRCHSGRHKIAA